MDIKKLLVIAKEKVNERRLSKIATAGTVAAVS